MTQRILSLLAAALCAGQLLGGVALAAGEAVPLNPFNLPPGASVTITFDVDVDNPLGACATGLSNQGTVTGTGISVVTDDPTLAGASDPTLTPLDAVELAITVTDGAATRIPGTPVTYTIVASNAGPSPAAGAVVTGTFPPTLSAVSWSCVGAGGAICTAGGAGDISDLVNIPVGGSVTYTATATIAADATGTLVTTATVSTPATQVECGLLDNSATDTDTLTPQVDLVLVKSESVDPVSAGSAAGNLTHTITVTNAGPSTATAVTILESLTLPAGVTLVSATPSQGTFTSPVWVLGTLAPSDSATLTVVMTVDASTASGTDVVCDTASVSGATETLINTADDSDTECTSVAADADLSIVKLDDADPAGNSITYTIAVTNNGPANATGVVVTDPLPAATTYVSDTCGASNAPPWTWNVGSLTSGATISCNLVVSVNPAPPASISNTATVAAATTDPVPGNNSAIQVTALDNVPPTIVALDTLPPTPGGLTPGEVVLEPVTHILVTFSEAMNDPAGNTGADDVTNPLNYRLVDAGPNGLLETASCSATPAGDDLFRPIAGVTYDSGIHRATVDLGGVLPSGRYRFLACGSTTLRDVAGNPLDAGSDFDLDFQRVSGAEVPTLGGWMMICFALLLTFVAWRRLQSGAFAALLVASALLAAPAPAAAQTTIDSFTTNQAALSEPPGGASSVTGGADIIGTRRGLVVDNLAGAGPTTVAVAGGNLNLTVAATTPKSRGEARLSWDGDTNPSSLTPTGLGGIDLTAGNASGFRIRFTSTSALAEIEMTVYSSAANFSRAARLVPISAGTQDVPIPFAEFRIAGGTGASFASVGAILLTLRSGEGTVVCGEIVTTPPAIAATKVDAQIADIDGDARVDLGDRVRYTVTITNTGNQALNVDLADSVDANSTLVAGSVRSTPVANGDQYGTFTDVPFTADGSPVPTLLANDSDPDGGTVTVQAGSFPASSSQGGALALVNAATGAFTYTPPAGFTGVDSFSYTIVDVDANSANATASIAVGYVDIRATVSPSAETHKVGDPGTFTIAAEVTQDGSTWTAAPAGTVLNFGYAGAGAIQTVNDPGPNGTSCTLVAGGSCTVTVVASTPGTGTLTVTSASSLIVDNIQAVPPAGTIPVRDADPTAADSRVGVRTFVRYMANVQASDTNLVGDPHTFTITAASEDGTGPDPDPLTGGVAQFAWNGAVWSGATTIAPGLHSCALPCSVTVISAVPFQGTITLTQVTSIFNGGTVTLTATPGVGLVTSPGGSFTQTKTWGNAVASVTPAAATSLIRDASTFTIAVGVNDAVAPDPVPAPAGSIVSYSWAVGGGPPNIETCTLVADNPITPADETGTCVVTKTLNVPATATLTVVGIDPLIINSVTFNNAPVAPASPGSLSAQTTWIAYDATISGDFQDVIGQSHTFTVTVTKDTGGGPQPVAGVQVFATATAPGTLTSPSCVTSIAGGVSSCGLAVSSAVPGSSTVTLQSLAESPFTVDLTIPNASGSHATVPVAATVNWIRYLANVQASDTNLVGDSHTFTITADSEDGIGPDPDPLSSGVAQFSWNGAAPSSGATAIGPGNYSCTLPCSVTVDSAVPFQGTISLTQVSSTFNGGTVTLTAAPGVGLVTTPGGSFTQTKTWGNAVASVTPAAATSLIRDASTFTIAVGVNDAVAPDPVPAPAGSIVSYSWAVGGGPPNIETCTLVADNPITPADEAGTCVVTKTLNIPATATLTVVSIDQLIINSVTFNNAPVAAASPGSLAATTTWVAYDATISGDFQDVIGQSHTFTVTVTKDTGSGPQPVAGVQVFAVASLAGTLTGSPCVTAIAGGVSTCDLVVLSAVPASSTVTLQSLAESPFTVDLTTQDASGSVATVPVAATMTWIP